MTSPAATAGARLAVLLPHAYLGGTIRLLQNLVRHLGARWPGPLVLGIPAAHLPAVAAELDAVRRDVPGLEIRGLHWRQLEPDDARALAAEAGLDVGRWISGRYQVPTDGGADFRDCGFWLFVSDRLEYPLVPLRPYGVFVTDHLQRYVPEIFDATAYADPDSAPWNFLRNVRNADLVVATSRDTAADVIGYAGARGPVVRLPTTLDVDHFTRLAAAAEAAAADADGMLPAAPFFAWVTNPSPHKNQFRMLRAIDRYLRALGGGLEIVVTGVWTDLFDPDLPAERRAGREPQWNTPHVCQVRETVAALAPEVRRRIRFLGAVPDDAYARVLRSARFLAHNVIADNGTFSAVEAALLGTPAVSSDYPQMREIDEAFGLGLRFFDPFDERATAEALLAGESLPPPPDSVGRRIRDLSWRAWDDSLVEAIGAVIAQDARVGQAESRPASRARIACL
jgi:glycosyltransferase involved in cell wall biosynthesis